MTSELLNMFSQRVTWASLGPGTARREAEVLGTGPATEGAVCWSLIASQVEQQCLFRDISGYFGIFWDTIFNNVTLMV